MCVCMGDLPWVTWRVGWSRVFGTRVTCGDFFSKVTNQVIGLIGGSYGEF